MLELFVILLCEKIVFVLFFKLYLVYCYLKLRVFLMIYYLNGIIIVYY